MMHLYIIHFAEPFHHARHYVGITSQSLKTRLKKHRNKDGSRITRAAVQAGIKLESIHLIGEYNDREEARAAEIKLKSRHQGTMMCPKCRLDTRARKTATQKQRRSKIMEEMQVTTERGPITFRARQVVFVEGAFFVIESVNVVKAGRQIRMYHMPDSQARQYYVPRENQPPVQPRAPLPTTRAQRPTAAPIAPPVAPTPGDGTMPSHAMPGAIQGPEQKPIVGLADYEIQEGLASGQYIQNENGEIFANPEFSDPQGGPSNATLGPGAHPQD